MLTRRAFTRAGVSSLILLGGTQMRSTLAQTPQSAGDYQGMMLVKNIESLPKAPAGECAVVLQAIKDNDYGVAVYHNATDIAVAVNGLTATSSQPFKPEETLHAPHVLQPGDYGMAFPAFGLWLEPEDELSIELDIVPAEEVDPTLIMGLITGVSIEKDDEGAELNFKTQNRSEYTIAEEYGVIGIFFTPDGQILDAFRSNSLSEFEPKSEKTRQYGHNAMEISDSYMMALTGRILE